MALCRGLLELEIGGNSGPNRSQTDERRRNALTVADVHVRRNLVKYGTSCTTYIRITKSWATLPYTSVTASGSCPRPCSCFREGTLPLSILPRLIPGPSKKHSYTVDLLQAHNTVQTKILDVDVDESRGSFYHSPMRVAPALVHTPAPEKGHCC